jgi:hypothetical protein
MAWIGADVLLTSAAWAAYAERRHCFASLMRFKFGNALAPDRPLTHRPRWVSSQPAPNPDRLPKFISQRMAPYPQSPLGLDWNCFTYAHITERAPIFLRGTLSDVRTFSISFYAKRHVDRAATGSTPNGLDGDQLRLSGNKYEVCVGPRRESDNWIDSEGEPHGMIALRHYVFRGETSIHYPAVYWGERLMQSARVVQVKSKLARQQP